MTYVQTQYREVYAPRTVSRTLLKSLVAGLANFKSGLPTVSRKIKARAISHGKITDLEGPDSWKVIDPHPLAELEHVDVELLLTSTGHSSCELHVEFRGEHIFLSVSDIETGWGKSVYEEMRHLLGTFGISSKGLKERLRRAYGLLTILQNVMLVLSVGLFTAWLTGHGTTYLYASLGLFVAGVMPAMTLSFRFLFPPKKVPLFQETIPKSQGFPWVEGAAILGFLGAVMQLVKELVAVAW